MKIKLLDCKYNGGDFVYRVRFMDPPYGVTKVAYRVDNNSVQWYDKYIKEFMVDLSDSVQTNIKNALASFYSDGTIIHI